MQLRLVFAAVLFYAVGSSTSPLARAQDANAKTEWSIAQLADEPAVDLSQAEIDFPGYQGELNALAFSPDGKWLATTASGGDEKLVRAIRLWNLQTGKPELLLQGPQPGEGWKGFGGLFFTPDSAKLISTDTNGEVQTWDLTNRTAGTPLKFESWTAFPVLAVSGDGKTAGVAVSKSVNAVDLATGKITAKRPPVKSSLHPVALAVSSDGKYIANANFILGEDQEPSLEMWSIVEKKLLWRGASRKQCGALKFSADDKQLVVLEEVSKRLVRYDVADGKADDGVDTSGGRAAFAPDGSRMLLYDYHAVNVADTESGRNLVQLGGSSKFPETLTCGAISRDGTLVAVGGEKGFLRLIQVKYPAETKPKVVAKKTRTTPLLAPDGAPRKVTHTLAGHTGEVRSIDYSPDGKRLISCSDDGTIRVWNARTGEAEKTYAIAAGLVRVLRDGKTLLVQRKAEGFGQPRAFALIDLDSGKLKQDLEKAPQKLATPYFRGLAPLPDGRWIGSTSTEFALWKLPQAGPEKTWKVAEPLESLGLFASPDGTRVATDDLVLWDVPNGKQILRTEKSFMGHGRIVSFSHDGQLLAGIRTDGASHAFLHLWNAETGEPIWETNISYFGGTACAFSPNDQIIATAGLGKLNLYDASNEKLLEELKAKRFVYDVVFSPDGRQLAECAKEPEIQLWDVSAYATPTEAPADVATEPAAEPFRLWKSADGKFEVEARLSGESDGKVQLVRKDGRTLNVARESLSPADVRYVDGRKRP